MSCSGNVQCIGWVHKGKHYTVTPSLIGWPHTQNNPCILHQWIHPYSTCTQLLANFGQIYWHCNRYNIIAVRHQQYAFLMNSHVAITLLSLFESFATNTQAKISCLCITGTKLLFSSGCTACSKYFASSTGLKDRIKKHSGEKPAQFVGKDFISKHTWPHTKLHMYYR